MEVASLIIATLALILGAFNLGLHFAPKLTPKSTEVPEYQDESLRSATQAELEAHFGSDVVVVPQSSTNIEAQEIIKQAQAEAFDDSFAAPDEYGGINEEFSI